MKLASKSAVLVPVLLFLCGVAAEGGDETCSNGIPGIDGNGVVCCPVGCGQCGGEGCTSAGAASGLGWDDCCGAGVKSSGKLCSTTGSAPCIIDDAGSSDSGFSGGEYGETFTGDATFYGETAGGHCSFFNNVPRQYNGMIAIALNGAQYGDSLMCGACVEGMAIGEGSGSTPIPSKFKGYITDECPGCKRGDLDFAMSGDGRWKIEWKFVECPGEDISFVSPSANPHYWKLQPRGTKTPVKSLKVAGQNAERTKDNHFVLYNPGKPWPGKQDITTTTVGGDTEITNWTFY